METVKPIAQTETLKIEIHCISPRATFGGGRGLCRATVVVIEHSVFVGRRGGSISIIVLIGLPTVGRGVVTVGSSPVHEPARVHSCAIRGPLRSIIAIAIVIWLLITSRIVVGMRRCEGGGSRKHWMSLECELGYGRTLWFVCGKVRVQTVLESCVDGECARRIRDLGLCWSRHVRVCRQRIDVLFGGSSWEGRRRDRSRRPRWLSAWSSASTSQSTW